MFLMRFKKFDLQHFCFSNFRDIFQNDYAEIRVKTYLKMTHKDLYSRLSLTMPQIISIPSKISLTDAKEVRKYIYDHKIPENIRILHALAHIQFNAFLAYLDTCFRFTKSLKQIDQEDFFRDMNFIANDQGRHFLMLSQRLKQLNYEYGSLPVISNLTNTVHQTCADLKARLAAISILHEGKGIASINKLINKIKSSGDIQSLPILEQIRRQEKHHFLLGKKWLTKLCYNQNLSLETAINELNLKFNLKLKLSDLEIIKS